jgi:glycerol-3-phosphate dehydrogenase
MGMLTKYAGYAYPICQCGQVLAAEVVRALDEEWAETISDIRRRTRSGMGTCQGINCLPRIAALYRERKQKSPQELREEMANFLQERWNGMHLQDIQGDMVSQVMMLQTIYGTVANLPGISRCVAGEGGGE